MRIIFAASEVYPIAKTGGLGDVAGSLPKALAARGHQVSVILPRYGSVRMEGEPIGALSVPMGEGKVESAALERTFLDPDRRVQVFLVNHQRFFGSRSELYGLPDDGLRFAFFSRAVLQAILQLDLKPDVLHCHDWHTGLVPAYLAHLEGQEPRLRGVATVFTIHNLMYQGVFGREVFSYTGLPSSAFSSGDLEFYGNVSFLKAGIVYADRVNTVSPTYAQEIQRPERGHGLDGLLRYHRSKLSGIVNGIDYDVWDPARDPNLPVSFDEAEQAGKARMRSALRQELGLTPDERRPLLAFIGRLVDQKGMDIIMPVLDRILARAQLVILGTGDAAYHRRLQALDGRGSLAIFLKFDEDLAHRIYAGSDAFLMPSWFEPCGLGQLIALRYGTLPIVRRTGGLADTVLDADRDPQHGTGFAFDEYRPEPLLDAVERAVRAFADRPRWAGLVSRAMAQDFSWGASTGRYEELYQSALDSAPAALGAGAR